MKDLSRTLLAAQKAEAIRPYVKVEYSPDGVLWTDVSADVLLVSHDIQPYSGSASIILNNYKGTYDSFDYRERPVRISYAMHTPRGIEYPLDANQDPTFAPYVWITSWNRTSQPGLLQLELTCETIWEKISRWRSEEEKEWAAGEATLKEMLAYVLLKMGITLGTSILDDSLIDTLKPAFRIDVNELGSDIILLLLNQAGCWLIPRTGTLHLKHLQASDSSVRSYHTIAGRGEHTAFGFTRSSGAYSPNKVTIVYDPDGSSVSFTDPDAIDIFPVLADPAYHLSQAEALVEAELRVNRAKEHRDKGSFSSPIDLGLEIYDVVTIKDKRGGPELTEVDRVGGVSYYYSPRAGRYNIGVRWGGLSSYIPVEGKPTEVAETRFYPVQPTVPITATMMKKAIQPYNSDIVFSAGGVPHDDLDWAAGTITFADGGTQAIAASAGEGDSLVAGGHYVYFDLLADDPTVLKVTQTYSEVIGENRGLVCYAEVSALDATSEIGIWPVGSKGLNLIVDFLAVQKLSAIVADMGLLTAGEILLGSGTVGVDFTGIRIHKTGAVYQVAGYDTDVLQSYMDSDGKFYAGAGAVWMDASGYHQSPGLGNVPCFKGGSYSGDGVTTGRQITTDFQCKYVIIHDQRDPPSETTTFTASYCIVHYSNTHTRSGQVHLHATDGFVVGDGGVGANENTVVYQYVALG